jgi:hypothetical protein
VAGSDVKLPKKREVKAKKGGFDFFFKRTCFRTMTSYYKTFFGDYLEQCQGLKDKEQVLAVVRDFCSQYQPHLLTALES